MNRGTSGDVWIDGVLRSRAKREAEKPRDPKVDESGCCRACQERSTPCCGTLYDARRELGELLDSVEAVIRDGELDLSDVTSPAKAKDAQLELVAHIRDQLAHLLEGT